MTTTVTSTWAAPEDAPLVVLEARDAGADVHGFMLSRLPLTLRRPPALLEATEPQQAASCELKFEWPTFEPLRCQQLKLELVSSARHVELFIEGVRRSMLGEEEQGEVYLGTFRGAKSVDAPHAAPQLFSVSHEFFQRDASTNILKEMHSLRVKFVSLVGDKSALHLQELKCAFVPLEQRTATVRLAAPPPVLAMPPNHLGTDQAVNPSALNGVAAQLAGLGLGGAGDAGDAHALMKGFQQMLEREMETKIMKAVDEKLARLSQRLAFTEQRLFQLHQQVDASGNQVRESLEQIKQQFASLESHVKEHLSGSVGVRDGGEATVEAREEGDGGE